MRLSQLGEVGLLAELERRGLVEGIENDAAELADGLVVTQDALLEGVHFRLDWLSWRDLGWRAAAVNLSDLAASGATPEALVVTLGLPSDSALSDVVELYEGLAEPGVPVTGGGTTRAEQLVLAVTAVGRSDRVPGRAGALPGDVLVVTGPLGAAAAGLHALRKGLAGFEALVARHRRPPLRLEEGRRLGRVAHALIDLSDGIGGDAARIAERSGCRVVLEPERIPRAPGIEAVADLPFWTMGEDYELLAALAPEDADALGFPVVGRCEEGAGVEPAGLAGWDALRD
jgi:thiamine-monophosphate kinase